MGEAIRALVLHDREGNIATLIVGPAEGPPATIPAESDQLVSEVDATESPIDWDDLETEERAREVLAQHRIEDGKILRTASKGE
jgi:hypothetical protein